jgi:hypothetical protein
MLGLLIKPFTLKLQHRYIFELMQKNHYGCKKQLEKALKMAGNTIFIGMV